MEDAAPIEQPQASDAQSVLMVAAAPPDPETQAQLFELAGLFLVAAVVIFCGRRLLDLFRADHD